MENVPTCNAGRSNLPSESVSVPAARELAPTPVVTCSDDVSRTERPQPWSLGHTYGVAEVPPRLLK